ncbi:MAG: bifunctional folylpolyglutamate synthase/dihydrofolate synthase [Magnetococcales bacterium]|nr:bifunctional folylpolyglutamate synthase/dihydrofolate synthase [Magnetococcales bacterium]
MKTLLSQILERMAQETPPGILLGLDRVQHLLERLGNPQRQLRFIHVAGTNGKGSVIAFLEAIFKARGIRVGAYTSPHLVRFNERIRLQGEAAPDEVIVEALSAVLEVTGDIPSTWFEKITAAAFWLFARHGLSRAGPEAAMVLLETGLGGRLDATNVVLPELTLITALGLDHCGYLGSDLASIAREKAGIFKEGVTAISSCSTAPALEVLLDQARRIGTPILLAGRDYRYRYHHPGALWEFEDAHGRLELPPPGLGGLHQYENAALAVAAARALPSDPWSMTAQAIAQGLVEVYWPGRLHSVSGTPDLLLDGAHNPLGMTALAQSLSQDPHPPRQRTVIFSALQDKDIHSMVKILSPWVEKVIVVSVGGDRGCPGGELRSQWQHCGKSVQMVPDFLTAWSRARELTPEDGQILITGSLYLVGQACSLLHSLLLL